MRIILSLFLLVSLMLALPSLAEEPQKHSYIPKGGFVPDKETAIRIAEAVWIPIYGAETINDEKPFKAALRDGVWTVEGSLPEGVKGGVVLGGVAVVEISKNDGRIIRVSHGK